MGSRRLRATGSAQPPGESVRDRPRPPLLSASGQGLAWTPSAPRSRVRARESRFRAASGEHSETTAIASKLSSSNALSSMISRSSTASLSRARRRRSRYSSEASTTCCGSATERRGASPPTALEPPQPAIHSRGLSHDVPRHAVHPRHDLVVRDLLPAAPCDEEHLGGRVRDGVLGQAAQEVARHGFHVLAVQRLETTVGRNELIKLVSSRSHLPIDVIRHHFRTSFFLTEFLESASPQGMFEWLRSLASDGGRCRRSELR